MTMKKVHTHYRKIGLKGYVAPCGYHAQAGYGMTVAGIEKVTCPRCRAWHQSSKGDPHAKSSKNPV